MYKRFALCTATSAVAALGIILTSTEGWAQASATAPSSQSAAAVSEFWTPQRMRSAVPIMPR
jgi:hypothetical protein